eukprot:TRINITY_DN89_c0_g1_i1.p1 TRINITY_DN89_c0_g1~~TRINITY_DN89_c0_g1_i1.p1  ORF type:complete len:283 (+),score=-3.51 TRINITY_DN89_c0_g1_i1:677-1525(+)
MISFLSGLLFLCFLQSCQLDNFTQSPHPAPVLLFFAPHKSGSSFIQNIFTQYASELQLCQFRTSWMSEDACFERDKCFSTYDLVRFAWPSDSTYSGRCEPLIRDMIQLDCFKGLREPSYCNSGFVWVSIRYQLHDFQQFLTAITNLPRYEVKVVYHVRNPLDQLVSEYYSFGYIHQLPRIRPGVNEQNDRNVLSEFLRRRELIRNMTVDEYVLQTMSNATWWKDRYGLFFSELGVHERARPFLVLSRYEDMVKDFPSWLRSLKLNWTNPKFMQLSEQVRKLV